VVIPSTAAVMASRPNESAGSGWCVDDRDRRDVHD
jgi:hypothetical protein